MTRKRLMLVKNLVCIAALTGIVSACSGDAPAGAPVLGKAEQALAKQSLSQLTVELPNDLAPQLVAVASSNSLTIADRAKIQRKDGKYARVVNTGTGTAQIGVQAVVGDIWSRGIVDLRNNAQVEGNVFSTSTVKQQPGVTITGQVTERGAPGQMRTASWQPRLPTIVKGDVNVEPDRSTALDPASYGQLSVKSRSTVTLRPGTYVFDQVTLEPDSHLLIDSSAGPVVLYVKGDFVYRGTISDSKQANADRLPLLVVALGANVPIERSFRGTVFAPNGRVTLSPATHFGAFFARDLVVQPDAMVILRAFPWSQVLPQEVAKWTDAPVELAATKTYDGKPGSDGVKVTSTPTGFKIPQFIQVRRGNSGNGQLEFKFRNGTQPIVTCLYNGGARVSHPITELERLRGRRYAFDNCTLGHTAGQIVQATWFSLRILGGDAADATQVTDVSVSLGGGCSEVIPAPLAPEEVVAIRDKFDWMTTASLNETDPTGKPAIWHGLIYVESKAQLAALDRLRVYWSTRPISQDYNSQFEGKCGRVEHATDGRGTVVYALFPAKLYNTLRDFGMQAEKKGVAPPFKFIVPSTPNAPQYVNSDGSIAYKALASSRFQDWLATRPSAQPGWLSDACDWVSDTASDVGSWIDDNIIDPGTDVVESGFDYVAGGFDKAIDWAANALDDTWEQIQEGLQEFVLLFSDKVTVKLNLRMLNRDSLFAPGSAMIRTWGPSTSTGQRPLLVPSGTQVRVRQWGWGFLPVMDEATLADDGNVTLEAVQDDDGRGGDLCVELDADYGTITSDLIPNEVCDFAEDKFGNFSHDIDERLDVSQPDLHAFTQVKDGYDYNRTVIGRDPHKMDILTGWIANTMTKQISSSHRAMCLCLDFPGTGAGAITSAAAGGGYIIGGPIVAGLGIFAATMVEKDLWWPDASDADEARNSRGVMTHEYGHFTMCSALYAKDGAKALTGLISRVFEGQDDSRDDQVALMTESWADTFALQVVGGANYVHADGTKSGNRIGYCVQSPCMDHNYAGDNDYVSDDPFHDEMAKYLSLVEDAFDSSNGSRRLTNQPWNGDVWHEVGSLLEFSPSGYLTNDDEPVNLPGDAWKSWVDHWLGHGRTPNKGNVLGGLNDAMAEKGFNWCDRCEVFAPHYASTPTSARQTDPTGQARPYGTRFARWQACAAGGEMNDILGAPPDTHLNLDASCQSCPTQQYVSSSGQCLACPTGQVARGDHCEACPNGNIPSGNECSPCQQNEISQAGQCVACPAGFGADHAANACILCPADAVVDWNAIPKACNESVQLPIAANSSQAGQVDVCPNEFWVEVRNLGVLAPRGSKKFEVSSSPYSNDYNNGVPQNQCLNSTASLEVFGLIGAGTLNPLASQTSTPSWHGGNCSPGIICLPTYCSAQAAATLTPSVAGSGSGTVRLLGAAQPGNGNNSGYVTVWSDTSAYPGCSVP